MRPHEDPRWLEAVARHTFAGSVTESDDAGCARMPSDLLDLWLDLDEEGPPTATRYSLGANQIIGRDEWGARPAGPGAQSIDPWGLALHNVGDSIGSLSHDRCFSVVRGIQSYHMDSQGWRDGAYSGLPCEHRCVFVMRGPGIRTAANGTTAANTSHAALCGLLGDGDEVTEGLQEAYWLGAEWLGLTEASWDPHSAFVSTSCPGTVREWLNAGHPRPGGEDLSAVTPHVDGQLGDLADNLRRHFTGNVGAAVSHLDRHLEAIHG